MSLLNVPFEIIGLDDCSTSEDIIRENSVLNQLRNVQLLNNEVNIGNASTRIKLSKLSSYNWLLFLDADTMPVHKSFMETYMHQLEKNSTTNVFLGTIRYQEDDRQDYKLKLLHGKACEVVNSSNIDNKQLNLRGANFLIEKKWFQEEFFMKLPNKYGYIDTVFEINLRLNGAVLTVIDNPVYHLGVERTESFLKKTQLGLENAAFLEKNHPNIAEHLRVVRFHRNLKKKGFMKIFHKTFNVIYPFLEQNLRGKKPSLKIFQLYKLGIYNRFMLS